MAASHIAKKLEESMTKFEDPEGEEIELKSKFQEEFDADSENTYPTSSLRSRNAPLLDVENVRYCGQKISRKSLEQFNDQTGSSESEGDEVSEGGVSANDDDGAAIESFKQQIHSDPHNLSSMEESHASNEELSDDDEEPEASDASSREESDEMDDTEDTDVVEKFSRVNMDSENKKSNAVKIQIELWHKLCECRIRLQKLLGIANRLPQYNTWNEFKNASENSYSENLNKGQDCVRRLLNNLTDLQGHLFQSDPEITAQHKKAEDNEIGEDEIPSDGSEGEEVVAAVVEKINDTVEGKATRKRKRSRKLKLEDFEDHISKQHKVLKPYWNSSIHYWDEKTRLTTGHMTQKSFNTFDQSALKQISQILLDKQRLIRRTQLKRSVYRVLGKPEQNNNEADTNMELDEDRETVKQRDEHLKDYDSEIFDDEDFYRQLLKDVIESRSLGIDSELLSKQLEIHKMRSKIKRKVDTKASKGRKIRFDVHPKLVNFMAPLSTCTMADDARNELFKSLFGQCVATG